MSDIRWTVFALTPIGEVRAPNIWTARALASRTYPDRVESVRSVASIEAAAADHQRREERRHGGRRNDGR